MIAKGMYKTLSLLLLKLLMLSVCNCQSQALYSQDVREKFSKIMVLSIDSIEGAEIYKHLQMFFGNSAKEYTLKVEVIYDTSPLVISHKSDVLRTSIVQEVQYELMHQDKVIHYKKLRISSSYDTFLTPFGSYMEEMQVKKSIAQNAANEIIRDIAYFFRTLK